MIDSKQIALQKKQQEQQKRLPTISRKAIPGGSLLTHRMDPSLMIDEVPFTEESGRNKYSFNALESAWGMGAQKTEVKAVLVEDEEITQEAIDQMRMEAVNNMFAKFKNTAPKTAQEVALDEEAEFQRSDFNTPEFA